METGPIFRSMMHNKNRFWLVALEIALTLAIVVNCSTIAAHLRGQMLRPTGMDEPNILVVQTEPFAPDFKNDDYIAQVRNEDLRLLRARSGVVAATAMHAVPLSGGGSSTGRKAVGSPLDTIPAPYYAVGLDVIPTLGLDLEEGRPLVDADYPIDENAVDRDEDGITRRNVLVTRSLADKLFPDGHALGAQIQNGEGTTLNTIVGIIRRMHGSWPHSPVLEDVMLYPARPGSARRMIYMVHAKPGAVQELYTGVEEALLASNPGRIVTVKTLAEIKAQTYATDTGMVRLFTGLIVLLFAVTSLGIVGLTSFSVTQRFRQIGTRRALGATRLAVLRFFLVENWIVSGIGLAAGTALSFGLNMLLVKVAGAPPLAWPVLVASVLIYWAVGLGAALLPAMRSMSISPVVATRTV